VQRSREETVFRVALPLPAGAAVCLQCAWLAPVDGDAGAAAIEHTWTTGHPSAYRPLADAASERSLDVGNAMEREGAPWATS
jgi:hypothetical protein